MVTTHMAEHIVLQPEDMSRIEQRFLVSISNISFHLFAGVRAHALGQRALDSQWPQV